MSEDFGKHFTGVEDLLQKHTLVESDVQAQAERVKQANLSADEFLDMPPGEDGELFRIYFLTMAGESKPRPHEVVQNC